MIAPTVAPDVLETIIGPEYGRRLPPSRYPRPAEGLPCTEGEPDTRERYTLCAMVPDPDGEPDDFLAGQELLSFKTQRMAESVAFIFARDSDGLPRIDLPDASVLAVFDARGNLVCRRTLDRE